MESILIFMAEQHWLYVLALFSFFNWSLLIVAAGMVKIIVGVACALRGVPATAKHEHHALCASCGSGVEPGAHPNKDYH